MRNFSYRFVTAKKAETMPPAPDGLAKQCPGRLMAVSKTLHINPQFANPKDVQTACGIAKGRPALATRTFLDRFVVTAKIAPSVLAQKQGQPQRPDPAIAKCAGVVGQTAKTLGIGPAHASQNDLNTSCAKGKSNPQLASFVFLNHFIGTAKITPQTKFFGRVHETMRRPGDLGGQKAAPRCAARRCQDGRGCLQALHRSRRARGPRPARAPSQEA
ncbi:MAG: hypothetical protein VW338_15830 [Rhodospirillaceae bacterium]